MEQRQIILGLYNEDYDNKYSYELDENPYGVNHIIDNNTGDEHYFGWDMKSNMTFHIDKSNDNSRFLCWTEDNRMQAVKDNNIRRGGFLAVQAVNR